MFYEQIGGQEDEEKTFGQRFLQILKWLFITLAIVVGISIFLFISFWLLSYFLGFDAFIIRIISWFCKNKAAYLALTIAPIILEIVGIGLAFVGVGIPIVGFGMFLEMLTILCDYIRQEPGWQGDVGLGIFGLIPIVGLFGNFGKVFKGVRKLF